MTITCPNGDCGHQFEAITPADTSLSVEGECPKCHNSFTCDGDGSNVVLIPDSADPEFPIQP